MSHCDELLFPDLCNYSCFISSQYYEFLFTLLTSGYEKADIQGLDSIIEAIGHH